MTRAALVLFVVTLVLFIGGRWVSKPFGSDVAARILETSARDHSETLRRLHRDQAASAQGYAFPVLIPLDLVFMISLGALFAVASLVALSCTSLDSSWRALVLILPLIYVIVDAVEDVVLVRMLTDSATVSSLAWVAERLTRAKLLSIWLCVAQLGLLSVVAAASIALSATRR